MKFWKEHTALRVSLIAITFAAGLFFTVFGWKMTGKLSGLGIMILGVVFILASLYIYNLPFRSKKVRKEKK